MKNPYAPYQFSACTQETCNPCKVANFFESDCKQTQNPYSRVFVVSQTYANCASPECTLRNGTYFNDLFMPYVPTCMQKRGCNCNGM